VAKSEVTKYARLETRCLEFRAVICSFYRFISYFRRSKTETERLADSLPKGYLDNIEDRRRRLKKPKKD